MVKIDSKKWNLNYAFALLVFFGLGFALAHGGATHDPGHTHLEIGGFDLPDGEEVCTTENSPLYEVDPLTGDYVLQADGVTPVDNPLYKPGCGIVPAPLLAPSGKGSVDTGEGAIGSGETESSGSASAAGISIDHLAKYDSDSNLVESGVIETIGESVVIGTGVISPQGALTVVNDEVRIGEGDPSFATGNGELYVGGRVEIGNQGKICLGNVCVDKWTESLSVVGFTYPGRYDDVDGTIEGKSYGCMKAGSSGVDECEIGSTDDYFFCALGEQVMDRGRCDIYVSDDTWYVKAHLFTGAQSPTQCVPYCLRNY